MTSRRDIDDGQPPEPDRHAVFAIDPFARIIRPAMNEGVAHAADGGEEIASRTDESCEATHEGAESSAALRNVIVTPNIRAPNSFNWKFKA